MKSLSVALLCLAIVPGSFSNDIHEYMSREEIQQVFRTEHVPEYEITKVHLPEKFHKRDVTTGRKLHLRAFGNDINLWLHPTENVLAGDETPVYYARPDPRQPEGIDFVKWTGMMSMVGQILEDPRHLASMVIGTEPSGKTTVNGHIASKKLAVRSIPTRVAEEYRRRRRSVGDSDDLDDVDSPVHVVFKTDEKYLENYPELPLNKARLQKRDANNVTEIPDTLYPEILVVVEHSVYKTFNNDIYGLLQYMLAFWNGVDLKYRGLESPNFRFHISGIVLGTYPEATPYISKNELGPDNFNSTKGMEDAGIFFHAVKATFPLDSYDISVTITRKRFGVGKDATVIGKAYVASACEHDPAGPFHNIAIVMDNGAFKGSMLAAHELGHLFSSRHDMSGGDCVTESGFIMAYTPWYTTNSSTFSPCSIKYIEAYLKADWFNCLYNKPTVPGKVLPRLMPGRMKSLEEQCKTFGLLAPCQKSSVVDHDVCTNIYCMNENGECRETGTGALDGTSCGEDGGFCLHMRCVKL